MRVRPTPGEILVTLPSLSDPAERRARWRQSITTLGQASNVDDPPPLDGIGDAELVATCELALETGLADDLDFIATGPAGVALYELMTALPQGQARRELGRRVFTRLYGGPAGAFSSVATRMVWSSVKQLQSATMRARVSLCLSLPIGSGVNAAPLAMALVQRREHFDEWVIKGASGPLHARRQAAVILEQAAREAVRRGQSGDEFPARLMTGPAVKPALERLLADREPLVWRHAAVARGLLAGADTGMREEIELALDPGLSPTEWRRAMVSLVTCVSHDPDEALAQCRSVLRSDLAARHPGLLATCAWGLAPVIEQEPELAEELLNEMASSGRPDAGAAIAALLRDIHTPGLGVLAAAKIRESVATLGCGDETFVTAYIGQASGNTERIGTDTSIYASIRRALIAYETSGASTAQELAVEALDRASGVLNELETRPSTAQGLLEALPLLADLDASALERSRLYDLLLLGRRPGDTDATAPRLENLYQRLGDWLLARERSSRRQKLEVATHARRQKLVTFLHLLDVQTTQSGAHEAVAGRVRDRIRGSLQELFANLLQKPAPGLHRVTCAALSRSFDAAIREQVADACDLVLIVMFHLRDLADVQAILDASTDEHMRRALRGYHAFLSALTPSAEQDPPSKGALPRAFADLSVALGHHGSYRGEALRRALMRTGRALDAIATTRSLAELIPEEAGRNPLMELEHQLQSLVRLTHSALNRVLRQAPALDRRSRPPELEQLSQLIERVVRTGQSLDAPVFKRAVDMLTVDLTPSLAPSVRTLVARLLGLPMNPTSRRGSIPRKPSRLALPDWLLPRRTIGAFYVVRPIGNGGVSSVFLAKRIEERRDPNAEVFALKVPQFDPTMARSVSEHEFLEMFRDEAGALLSLPRHTHLARFVNFDLAAKPKPILVMEMIHGDSLEKLIRTRSLTIEKAFTYLDGILAGLSAMHRSGVAHLDVKPSNVILRDEDTPVLVDFGLSGQKLRPGCGTPEYCAPEVLGVVPEGLEVEARPADLYAFACTAIQVLTGQLLFAAEEEAALISQHISHDGWPAALAEFARGPGLHRIATVFGACMRRDPRLRPTPDALRAELSKCTAELPLSRMRWPLPLHGQRLESIA